MKYKNEKIQRRLFEGLFIVVAAVSLFLLLALFTYNPKDPSWSYMSENHQVKNSGGYLGALLADILFCGLGYMAYALPILFIYAAWLPCSIKKSDGKQLGFTFVIRYASFILLLLSASTLLNLNLYNGGLPFGSGGIIGSLFSNALLHFLNLAGANLLLLAVFLSSMTLFSGISWIKAAELLGGLLLKFIDHCGALVLRINFKKCSLKFHTEPKTGADRFAPPVFGCQVPSHAKSLESLAPAMPKTEDKPLLIAKQQPIKTSRRAEEEKQINLFEEDLEGTLPPLSLLDRPSAPSAQVYSDEQLENISQEVELRLRDFGVEARVVAVHPGPVVTRFELQPAAGTKVSRITALAKDLARSLSVTSVRIVEVIPGKSVIGLELPNAQREIVRLREILSSQQYESARAPLTIALGKDISGHPVIVDLAKMPHLLVAGTTGSGKSVGLNAILLSLLYKYKANEVRLIMIDPKMLELSIYDGIPHLLAPVVTDMKDAANALRWCVFEMERRYKLLAALGVRNLSGYNHKIVEAREKGAPILDPLWQEGVGEEAPQELRELPYIVVIADEYADMIMVVGKKIEELIARIAQKARAAGIHLILATQRPSVDVITGLIKANISTRIAFQVSSKIDSRTILDQGGAEQLLGFGDMLYLPPGSGVPIRIHGAFVADDEVHRVVKDLKRRAKPEYLDDVLSWSNANDAVSYNGNISTGFSYDLQENNFAAEQDPFYDQAVQIVLETRRASISQIQRRLRIGYNRAARMVEDMEKAGLVGPMEVNGNREVLAPAPPPKEEK